MARDQAAALLAAADLRMTLSAFRSLPATFCDLLTLLPHVFRECAGWPPAGKLIRPVDGRSDFLGRVRSRRASSVI